MRWPIVIGVLLAMAEPGTRAEGVRMDGKPRLIVLTDIGGDPDDQQSLVRLLVHANEFEIEGLVASASGTPGEVGRSVTRTDLIREIVNAYAEVDGNLRRHDPAFPQAADLLACIKSGNPYRGREAVGEGSDTEGSRLIIEATDRDDPRPLNVAIWGGQTDLAQALWIDGADAERAQVHLPQDVAGTEIHVILEVADKGQPALTRYRRAVIAVATR